MKTFLTYFFTFFFASFSVCASVGDLDTSFGGGDGVVTLSTGVQNNIARAVVLDGQDHILVAGYNDSGSDSDFVLIRFDLSGNLDLTFGTNGIVTTDLNEGSRDYAYALGVDSQGNIVLAGYTVKASAVDMALVRYDNTGTPDETFGTHGIVIQDVNEANDYIYGLAIDSSDKIVLAGGTDNGTDYDFLIARYDDTGLLDTTFNSTGIYTLNTGHPDFLYGVDIDSQNRIVAGGYTSDPTTNFDFAAIRLSSVGLIDNSFGTGGLATANLGGLALSNTGQALLVESGTDNVIMAGYSYNGSNNDMAVVRFKESDGTVDSSFGQSSGFSLAGIGTDDDDGFGLTVDSSLHVVVVGDSYNGLNTDFGIARFTSAGVFDSTFGGGDGKIGLPLSLEAVYETAYSAVTDADNNILIAGVSGTQMALVKLRGTDCGDGIQEGSEECDNPNGINGDDCDNNCTTPRCGNGAISPSEECDDGNTRDADGCNSACLTETEWFHDADGDTFGSATDYIYSLTQPVDPSYILDNTDCDDSTATAFPGNVELPSECDNDIDEDCSGADLVCASLVEDCTNSIDDDNDAAIDCADTDCASDVACLPVCGDNNKEGDEGCDDGNTTSGDGCSSTCVKESNWYIDSDGDGYGDATHKKQAVDQPSGYVSNKTDCDDADESAAPGNTETAAQCEDGIDQDCSGSDLTCEAVSTAEDCTNGVDDDGDGDVDCDDSDCTSDTTACPVDTTPHYAPLISGCSLRPLK